MKFNNINELNKFIEPYIIKALELTRDELFDIISEKVSDYYREPVFDGKNEPLGYKRTGKLMESLTASNILTNNKTYSFTVGWDDDYLEYTYPGWKERWGRGLRGKNHATGSDVLTYFNTHRHGGNGFLGSHNYWDEFIDEINNRGGIDLIFKKNLIKLGIPIK